MLTELILACSQAGSSQGAPPAEIPLSMRVNRAIALGVEFLERLQQPDGSVRAHGGQHPGGATALVAFTLLHSGVRKDDPAVARALRALAGIEFTSVYSASAHILLCEALRDRSRAAEAQRSLDFLLAKQERGVWAYPWGSPDNSNTQFALLGLRAARRMGLEVPEEALLASVEGLEVFQHKSGGYLYSPRQREPYAGITAAGLASLAVLQEAAADLPRLRAALERRSTQREAAEQWLERRFDPARNLHDDGSWTTLMHYAYLWAVERWCGLTNRERLAGRDWYEEGASWLVEVQEPNGSFGVERVVENTCFALLFLRRATVTPVEELAEIYAEVDRLRDRRPLRHRQAGPEARRLTEWWLAGPWTQGGTEPLLLDPPFDPADAQPRARGKLAGRDWERVSLERGRWTDLDKLADSTGDRQLWALATWLSVPGGSAAEPIEATLWLELEDGWDVWLDRNRLSRERRRSPTIAGDVGCALRLSSGEHLLTVLVEDFKGVAAFGALLSSPDNGAPPAGLVEHAEPPGK